MSKRSAGDMKDVPGSGDINEESFKKIYEITENQDENLNLILNKKNKKRRLSNADLNKFVTVDPFVELYGGLLTEAEQLEMINAYEECDGSRPMTRQHKAKLLKTKGKK